MELGDADCVGLLSELLLEEEGVGVGDSWDSDGGGDEAPGSATVGDGSPGEGSFGISSPRFSGEGIRCNTCWRIGSKDRALGGTICPLSGSDSDLVVTSLADGPRALEDVNGPAIPPEDVKGAAIPPEEERDRGGTGFVSTIAVVPVSSDCTAFCCKRRLWPGGLPDFHEKRLKASVWKDAARSNPARHFLYSVTVR